MHNTRVQSCWEQRAENFFCVVLKKGYVGTFGLLHVINAFILSYLCHMALVLLFHREGKVVLWIQMVFGRSGAAYSLSVATKNI